MDRDFTGGSKHRTIAGSIKSLFHAAARIIVHRNDDTPPAPSRRRSGKTEGDFYRLARGLLRAVFKGRAAARGRYASLRDVPAVPATPASLISVPEEYLYAEPDWNVFDISNPLYDHSESFDNDSDFECEYDTVNEHLSLGL